MVTRPPTTSARAGRHFPTVSPEGDSSCTSQLNQEPSSERLWALVSVFMRIARYSRPTAAATITKAQAASANERASTARQHRARLGRAGIPAAAGLLVLASCASGSAASPPATPPSTAAPTVPTTEARTTVPTTIAKPAPVTLPVPTIVTVPVANTAVAPTPAAPAGGAGAGGGGGSGGNATEGYGPFGPFDVGSLDDASRAAVASAVEAYLVAASVLPLRSREEPDLRAVLTPAALGRLTPQVLAVVADGADAGLPRLEGVSLVKADVGVDGIVGPDGGRVATASIDTLVTATTEGGSPVTIARRGNLVLVPGPSGWQIDELDLTVDRDLP